MRGSIHIHTLLCPILFLTTCTSRQGTNPTHDFEIYTEGGVTIAETGGGPKFSEPLFTYEEVLRLKQDEAVEASLLVNPFTRIMDEEGAFYITDIRPPRIICFDAGGNFSHEIGRQGEGPGEYQNPELLSVAEGIVTVYDRTLRRTTFFSTDGTYIESIPVPRGRLRPGQLHRGPAGEMILLGQEDEGGFNIDTYVYAWAMVLSAEGDTIAELSTEKVRRGIWYFLEEQRITGISWVHYNSWPDAWYHPSRGILLTCGIEPYMRWYDLKGRLLREVRLKIPPEPLSGAEKDEVLSTLRQRRVEATDERSRISADKNLELVEFRDPKAFWFGVIPDEDGYLWAIRPSNMFARPPGSPPLLPLLRLFSPEGEYLGDTEWIAPQAMVSRGYLLTVQEKEDTGELDVIVYRIRSAVAGFRYP